jgi:hypothetical protein
MKVTFIPQLFCIKDPMAYVYLQIGPYSYLRAYFPYDNIDLTPNIIFLLGFKATFHSTHLTLKGLYYIENTNIPLALYTTHIKHVYFTLESNVCISYYLNVTDFIIGLPNTSQRHDSIWVIVDQLTKTAHFLPVHTTYKAKKYAEIYVDQIVRLHGVPKMIISGRGAQFIARFWEQLQYALGTKLIRSSAYHPQTDGQTERVNQILEDMLRACVLQYDKNWDKCLSLAEFSYNNSYQTSLKMAPFEALYGRRCRTPLSWSQTGERKIFGPDLVTEAEEKVKTIQNNLKAAPSR